MPAISGMWEAEIGRIVVLGQLGRKRKSLQELIPVEKNWCVPDIPATVGSLK
jgi:hypothetical protein